MKVVQELQKFTPEKETALTIGVFDGVHLGHQHLLRKLIEHAAREGLMPGVVTFDQHPGEVLSPGRKLVYLADLEQRKELISAFGIQLLVNLSFTPNLSQLTARKFTQLLRVYLKLRLLVIGPDFALGRNREGKPENLQTLGKELGFQVLLVPPFEFEGQVVKSTLIRQALLQGELGRVAKLLGRNFTLRGRVVPGAERGRGLGFPTANIWPNSLKVLPPDGVYVTRVQVEERMFPSVTNIGVRPTFGGGEKWVEVHIPDFQENLYGKKLSLEFVERLRSELRFATSEDLKNQIAQDIRKAQTIIEKEGLNVGMA